MCLDPATLAIIGTAATVIGAGVGIWGTLQGGEASKKAAQYSARQDEKQADFILTSAGVDEQNLRRETEKLAGRQRAVMSASNIDISSGTALEVLGQTARYGEVDALTLRHNANRQARAMRESARITRKTGQRAVDASIISSFAQGVSTVGTLAGRWYDRGVDAAATTPIGKW